MNNHDKYLTLMALMSTLFDILEGRDVDLSDFDLAVEAIGFDAEKFRELPPFAMIYFLAEKLTDIPLTSELVKEIAND